MTNFVDKDTGEPVDIRPDFAMCIAVLGEKERKERERYGFTLYEFRELERKVTQMRRIIQNWDCGAKDAKVECRDNQ